MRRHVLAVAVFAVLASGGNAFAAGPYPPPSKGTGTVTPSRIQVGECAVFSGDGFLPLSAVAVADNGAARGTTTARTDGTFSMRLCYATDADRGRHDLTGSGTGADGQPLTVYAMLIVEGVQQSAANPVTRPGGAASGRAGGAAGGSRDRTPVNDLTTLAAVNAVDAPDGSAPKLSTGRRVFGVDTSAAPTSLGVGAVGLVTVFLGSLLLLLIARRRRSDDKRSAVPVPA